MLGGLGIMLTFAFTDVFQICIYVEKILYLCFFISVFQWFYKII
jgi:hypothetical protein